MAEKFSGYRPDSLELEPSDERAEISLAEARLKFERVFALIDDGRPESQQLIQEAQQALSKDPQTIPLAELSELLAKRYQQKLDEWGINQQQLNELGFEQQKTLQTWEQELDTPNQEDQDRAWYVTKVKRLQTNKKFDQAIGHRVAYLNSLAGPAAGSEIQEEQDREKDLKEGQALGQLYRQARFFEDNLEFLKDFKYFKLKETVSAKSEIKALPVSKPVADYLSYAWRDKVGQVARSWWDKLSGRTQKKAELTAQVQLEELRGQYHEQFLGQLEKEVTTMPPEKQFSLRDKVINIFTNYLPGLKKTKAEIQPAKPSLEQNLGRLRVKNSLLVQRNLEISHFVAVAMGKKEMARPVKPFFAVPEKVSTEPQKQAEQLTNYRDRYVLPQADFISQRILATRKELATAKDKTKKAQAKQLLKLLEAETKDLSQIMKDISGSLAELSEPTQKKSGQKPDLPTEESEAEAA